MPHTRFVAERLQFLEIGEDVVNELQRARRYVEPQLDAMLARFYEHILSEPGLKALFADDRSIDRARDAQKKHWLDTLLSGRFDSAYFERVEKIGRSHARVGLAPNWYIGGYSHMLAQFIGCIVDEAGKEGQDPQAIVQAVCKAVLLDLDLVIHCYLEAKNESIRQTLRRATEFAADIAELNAQARAATEGVLAAAAELKSDDTSSTAQLSALLSKIETLGQKSDLLDKRISDLQFGDKLFIDEDAPGEEGGLSRLKKLFRAR